MRSMKPADILRHENYAVMRFFGGEGCWYTCAVYATESNAADHCALLNDATRPVYGEDQYEVVAIDHKSID